MLLFLGKQSWDTFYNVFYTYQKLKTWKTSKINELTVLSVGDVPDPLGGGSDTFQHTGQPSQQPSYQNCCSDHECHRYLGLEQIPKLATALAAASSFLPPSPSLQQKWNSSHRIHVPSHLNVHAARPNGNKTWRSCNWFQNNSVCQSWLIKCQSGWQMKPAKEILRLTPNLQQMVAEEGKGSWGLPHNMYNSEGDDKAYAPAALQDNISPWIETNGQYRGREILPMVSEHNYCQHSGYSGYHIFYCAGMVSFIWLRQQPQQLNLVTD